MGNSVASLFCSPGLTTMRGCLHRPKARGSGDKLTLTVIEMILLSGSVQLLSRICYTDRKMTVTTVVLASVIWLQHSRVLR